MKHTNDVLKNDVLKKAGWLVLSLVFLFLSGGDQPVSIAVWLAPVFLLRFFRDSGAIRSFLVVLPCMVAVELLANRGMTPFPSFKILLLYTTIGVASSLIPYSIDTFLSRSLPSGLRTLLFPSLAISVSFLLGSYGSWGAKANGIGDLAFLQLVSVTGISGIAFLIFWAASVANEVWERSGSAKTVRNLVVAFTVTIVIVYGFGLFRLRVDSRSENSILAAGIVHDPSLRDELIDAFGVLIRSYPTNPGAIEEVRNAMKKSFNRLLSDSIALAKSGFDMTVWCEGAVVVFEEDERALIQSAAEKAREYDIYLGISVAVYQNQSRPEKPGIQPLFKNKLIFISPEGDIEWEYSKGILVPGMEAAITIPGDRIMKLSGSDLKITGAICYELDFPTHIRQAAMMNAELILAPANDWEAIKNTHARMSRLRAIENGIALFRPANGGVSIAVDPCGRILSRVDNYKTQGAPLTAAIPIGPVPTLYSTWGEYFNWLCLILSLACMILSIMYRFKKNKNHNPDIIS
jgi:apolipoprotein N-acyltransferase